MKRELPQVYPGKILIEDYIKERGLSVTEVAKGLCMPRPNLSKILNEEAGISPEMAVKLFEAFGMPRSFGLTYKKTTTFGMPRNE